MKKFDFDPSPNFTLVLFTLIISILIFGSLVN